MTAFEPRPSPPVGRDTSGPVTVSLRAGTTRLGSDTDGPISPWLYIAGALVTLAALYAVNFGLEDSGFALLTYMLAIGGYCSSYVLRVRGISLRGVQVPLLTLLGFFFLLSLLFGQGAGTGDSPSRNLQIALTWVAILHSYTLSNNAAVLFACVPGMTLIALVSTSTTEIEAQNAFFLFFGAATFLLIHENYLRTQAYSLRKSETRTRPVLFGSQTTLAAGCFVATMLLARATSVPMQFVGERIFPQGMVNAIKGAIKTAQPSSLFGNERSNYELASGPISATETPVLEVHCDEPLYWRSGTFDTYTGHSFKNNAELTSRTTGDPDQQTADPNHPLYIDPNQDSRGRFRFGPGPMDLAASQMSGSHKVTQHMKILAASTMQVVGAARIEELESPVHNLRTDDVGGLNLIVPFLTNYEYDVVSVVPAGAPEILRAAPSDQIPPEIALKYLQRATSNSPENPELARLAAEWTQGQTNNYDKARAIRHHIAERCSYNLNTPAAPRDHDIVAYFLNESKQGYCDSFGAAMTVMCRYAGIPARLAIGFIHGDEVSPHTFRVKEKDRHIWSEVFFPRIGWVAFDATDGANDITPQSENAQKKKLTLLAWLAQQGIGPKVIELLLFLLLAYLVKTELIDRIKPRTRQPGKTSIARPPANVAILAAYAAARKLLARRGLARAPHMTTVEFDRMVNALLPASEIGTALTELTELHDRYYYGFETAEPQEVKRADETLRRLKEALRQHKGDPARELQARKIGTA